jgi:hypothetical protein
VGRSNFVKRSSVQWGSAPVCCSTPAYYLLYFGHFYVNFIVRNERKINSECKSFKECVLVWKGAYLAHTLLIYSFLQSKERLAKRPPSSVRPSVCPSICFSVSLRPSRSLKLLYNFHKFRYVSSLGQAVKPLSVSFKFATTSVHYTGM